MGQSLIMKNTYDMELLKTMYWIHSPSGSEEGLQGFIRQELYKKGIEFYIDEYNQTYNFDNTGKPLLVAHADQVNHVPLMKLTETDIAIIGDSNLGADDKNGIWIILNLLDKYPDSNFCFSNKEEVGGDIDSVLYYNEELVQDIPYCLVFDRTGGSDIIGSWNRYCSDEFEDEVSYIGTEFGFKTTYGLFSDCDEISRYLNCVNISCGYYQAHSDKEYTIKRDLINSLEFGKSILKNITRSFEHNIPTWGSYGYGYGIHHHNHNYDDINSLCPACSSKLNVLTVHDKVESTYIEYGKACSICSYEYFYNSDKNSKGDDSGRYIEYKPGMAMRSTV